MAIDPHDAVNHAQAAADLLTRGDHSSAAAAALAHHLDSTFSSSITTATAAAADAGAAMGKTKYAWEFLWWHGEKVNPLGEFVSVPPLDSTASASGPAQPFRDYFLPDDPIKAAEAIKAQQQAIQAGAPPTSGIDSSQIKDALPGGRPEFFFDEPVDPRRLTQPLTADDLTEIARDGDILSRLPMVAFTSVLVDFFFINRGKDVYRDEIENEEQALREEWVAQVVPRLGIGIVLALLTIASSYMFYHPI